MSRDIDPEVQAIADTLKPAICSYICRRQLRGEETRPANLEDDFIGGVEMSALLMGTARWNRTPFALALEQLSDAGLVIATHDDGGWQYEVVRDWAQKMSGMLGVSPSTL